MKLKSKLKNFAARCIVDLLQTASSYQVTLFSGESASDIEHLQEFGLASRKPDGTQGKGVCLFYGGNRGNGTLLVMEFTDLKPVLENGESALFNAFDAIVKLDKDGVAQLNGITNEGIIKINELTAKLNAHITEYNIHVHSGVQEGSKNSLAPTVSGTPFVKGDYENTKVVH